MSTNQSIPLLLRLVSVSVAAANKAQLIIRNILKAGQLGIVDKGKNDPQTEADRITQISIVASLNKQFPQICVKGEEDNEGVTQSQYQNVDPSLLSTDHDESILSHTCPQHLCHVQDDQVVVWVDPVDGTREFTQGLLDHVTVLIGIAVNGVATAGIIAQPYYNYKTPSLPLGRVVWGIDGIGTFGANINKPPEGQNIITLTRSHSNSVVTDAVSACEPTETLPVGGCGHKALLVLEGKAHAYVFASQGCKKWDTCAPEAVLYAAGGKLTDLHGNRYSYNSDAHKPNTGGVLATVYNHDWYIHRIPQHVLEHLPSQKVS